MCFFRLIASRKDVCEEILRIRYYKETDEGRTEMKSVSEQWLEEGAELERKNTQREKERADAEKERADAAEESLKQMKEEVRKLREELEKLKKESIISIVQ